MAQVTQLRYFGAATPLCREDTWRCVVCACAGVVGLAAAVAGAAHVVLTDLGDLVPLLESNAHSVDCIVSQEHSGGGDGAATAKNASVEILRFEWFASTFAARGAGV